MFNVMKVPSQYVEIRTKRQFIAMMETTPFRFIHITMHGHVTKDDNEFRGFWTPEGTVKLEDLSSQDLQGKIVVSTACLSG